MAKPTNVVLSFDIEVWCQGWKDLDASFPAAFERYVYGRSRHGDYALPKTLEIMNRHGVHGVFFVEPLFAARFGIEHLKIIVALIRDAGQEVQLHLHPEWADEISPPPFAGATRKRQHLIHYSLEEQTTLLAMGCELLEAAGAPRPSAFRAGNFAVNRDTFRALARCGIRHDSSLNRMWDVSGPDLRDSVDFDRAQQIEGVLSQPVTVFRDGLGKPRPLQLAANGFEEIRALLEAAHAAGQPGVVAVSHNFEMLQEYGLKPDWFVVHRFERLCRFLGENRERFPATGFDAELGAAAEAREPLRVPAWTSLKRLAEQSLRRLAEARV